MKSKNELKALFLKYPHLLDPKARHDFVIRWACENGNPNGDPDNGGDPRQLPDGRLVVTDACYKRMLRDYLEEVCGLPIYISREAKQAKLSLKDQSAKYPKATDAIQGFYDVRMFGAVYLAGGKKGAKKDGEGEAADNAQILGPVQIECGFSDGPVQVTEMAIGRILKEDSNDGTFGRKTVVENVEITHHGRYSGNLGRKAGVTAEDMAAFWEAILNAPELKQSTMSGRRHHVQLEIVSYTDAFGLGEKAAVVVE